MYLSNQSLLVIIFVGIIAGWLAGKVVQRAGLWPNLGFDCRIDWGVHRRLAIASARHSLRYRYRGIDCQCLYWRRCAAAHFAPRQRLARWTEVGTKVVIATFAS